MATPYKFYMKHMNAKTGYRATWDPGKPLEIGMIGKLDGSGVFTVYSSLKAEGITPEIKADPSASDLDYTSSDKVSIGIKLSGSAPTVGSALTAADAGFEIKFTGEEGVVFKISGYKTLQIVNLKEIESQIKEKYQNSNWDKNWLVVTELIQADAATIIISNSKNGSLDLKAKAGVAAGDLKLTDAALGLSVARESGSTLKFLTQNGLTPLYNVMGLVHPLFGSEKLEKRSIAEILEQEPFKVQGFLDEELNQLEDQ
ncbi:hypothetical protein QG516_25880 [Pedobacter gandavensis]|uniref:hypothetical protein n=1 Tax=Pedobacter gandavensis TaxID=2679963 RepID=UPI00247AA5A7|nr:hypothetical protein [Pedobacter gandavensis]WGQ09945.1 hypothetical protein QG516_25880 [Pedobacter gandavensis]